MQFLTPYARISAYICDCSTGSTLTTRRVVEILNVQLERSSGPSVEVKEPGKVQKFDATIFLSLPEGSERRIPVPVILLGVPRSLVSLNLDVLRIHGALSRGSELFEEREQDAKKVDLKLLPIYL
ncbi:hypothetical protein CPB85DRAFT_1282561 [Mucidula mucida]|nr:hypothetical protein CPB85DRAFT_1282561 [Mucidula mucida]